VMKKRTVEKIKKGRDEWEAWYSLYYDSNDDNKESTIKNDE
jgi:hypothetical protein